MFNSRTGMLILADSELFLVVFQQALITFQTGELAWHVRCCLIVCPTEFDVNDINLTQ
jgi:hypothetical protein